MITVKYNGTLGNILWQYSVARLFAEQSGQLLIAPQIQGFSSCKTFIPGGIKLGKRTIYSGHYLPTEMPLQRTYFNGHFERYENIAGQVQEVKKWVKPDAKPKFVPDRDDLILSVRRGFNSWPIELCPSTEYYEALLRKFKYKRVWICTDSPRDPFIAELLELIPRSTLVLMNGLEQFSFISSANRVIMAPSTFTFWATLVGAASEVYWPHIPALDFSNTHYDWFPFDDPRAEWVDL